ncbi:MAG: CinA family protein [Nitrosomonas sp.]
MKPTISDTNETSYTLAQRIGAYLTQHELMLVTAESCTGGWLGQAITSVPGSSSWYERGFITYSNLSKQEMLGVQSATLTQYGAVSPQTAQEMVLGALNRSHAQIGVSITGIAGPDGGTVDKPIGMVCFAWATKAGCVQQKTYHYQGNREAIRHQAVTTALNGILMLIGNASVTV